MDEKGNNQEPPAHHEEPLHGKEVHAKYRSHILKSHASHPMIMALKAPPSSIKDSGARLARRPEFNKEELELSCFDRCTLVPRVKRLYVPGHRETAFHMGVYSKVVNSYIHRPVISADGQRILHRSQRPSGGGGLIVLLARSGVGKSTLVTRVREETADTYIRHTNFNGLPLTELQVSSMHAHLPESCSTKKLGAKIGKRLDRDLDVSLFERRFIMMRAGHSASNELSDIATNLHLGFLTIDDFQNLRLIGVGAQHVITMLHNMWNESGFPVVISGTEKMLRLFGGDFDLLRRITESGVYTIPRPKTWDDLDWKSFCKRMWSFQWLRDPVPISDEIVETLFDLSAGIHGIALSLFMTAQSHALCEGIETINDVYLVAVFEEHFSLMHAPVMVLKSGDAKQQGKYEDMYLDLWPQLQQHLNATFPFGSDENANQESGVEQKPAKGKRGRPAGGGNAKPAKSAKTLHNNAAAASPEEIAALL